MNGPVLYSLAEVAEMTGWSLRGLRLDARAGRFDHVHRGRERAVTPEQLAALIEAHKETSTTTDALAAVRARVARRRASRSA